MHQVSSLIWFVIVTGIRIDVQLLISKFKFDGQVDVIFNYVL